MSDVSFGDGGGTHGKPPNAYGVFDADHNLYGYAVDLHDVINIACAVALRSMIDVKVEDPEGNVQAEIGNFGPWPAAQGAPLSVVASVDPDNTLLVTVTTNKNGANVDWGDGSSSKLQGTSGTHTYATADSYDLIVTLGEESVTASVTLGLPPTLDLELGRTSGVTEEGL